MRCARFDAADECYADRATSGQTRSGDRHWRASSAAAAGEQRDRAHRRRVDDVDGLHLTARTNAAGIAPPHERLRRDTDRRRDVGPPIAVLASRDHPPGDPRPELRGVTRVAALAKRWGRAREVTEFAVLLHRTADENTSRSGRQGRLSAPAQRGPEHSMPHASTSGRAGERKCAASSAQVSGPICPNHGAWLAQGDRQRPLHPRATINSRSAISLAASRP